jgi:flagellar FliL protein
MPAKTEAKEAAPAPEKDKSPAPAADKEKPNKEAAPASEKAQAPAAGRKAALLPWAASLGAVVLAPALSWAVAQFVLLPHLQKKLAAPLPAAEDAAGGDGASSDAKTKNGPPPTYEFKDVVVNVAGTLGTRYLKVSFIVTGPAADLEKQFESSKARLTDVTLNVLSAFSMSDLEEPGSKNVVREKLVSAYNQALGHKVADQVYFSDFVVN